MLFFAYLPEVVAFLEFCLVSVQETPFGSYLVMLQMGLIGLLAIARPNEFLRVVLRWWPLLLVQVLAVVSSLWAELPSASFRYAAQYLFTALTGVFIARVLSPRSYLAVFVVSIFTFCVFCILYGRQGPSAEGMVLVGLTGSKNQLAYEAQILMLGAMAVLMMGGISVALRWIAVLSLPLSAYLLLETNSATAVVTAVGGSAVLLGLWFTQRLTAGGRLAALAGGIVVLIPLMALIPEAISGINHFVFDTLNKDPTLTGRTLLWARADDLIARRPLLGYGYQSIWMGDSTETTALRRLTGVWDGRVFHFHHQFRQIAIDTGFVGLVAFVGMLISVGFALLRQFLLRPSMPATFFFIIFMLMVTRAFIDNIVGPFSIHTLLFYGAAVYAFRRTEEAEQPTPAQSWSWMRRAGPAMSRFARR